MRLIALLLALLFAAAGCLDSDGDTTDGAGDDTKDDVMEPEPVEQSFAGSWTTDDPRCAPGGTAGAADLSYIVMDVADGTQGQGFFAVFSATGGLLELRIEWFDGDGTSLHVDSDVDGGEFYEIKDRVPADAATAHFYSCGGPSNVSYVTPG